MLAWKVFNCAWLTPKRLEKRLKEQGLRGNPYKLLYGDFKQISTLLKEAHSKTINLSDDLFPRVIPHLHEAVKKYGKYYLLFNYVMLSLQTFHGFLQ